MNAGQLIVDGVGVESSRPLKVGKSINEVGCDIADIARGLGLSVDEVLKVREDYEITLRCVWREPVKAVGSLEPECLQRDFWIDESCL